MARFLKAAGAALGLGVGGYAGQAYYQVYSADQEQARHERSVQSHTEAVSSLEASIRKDETQAEALLRQRHQQTQAVAEVDKRLTAARQEVLRLEEERGTKESELRKTEGQTLELRRNISKFQQQMQEHNHAVTAAQQAVAQARQHAAQARQQVNPLNHPLVKQLLSR